MTEDLIGLIWGIVIGFASAIPVGPVGIIAFQRTLAKNKISGLITGLGSSFADTLLAIVGAFSITFIFNFIESHHILLRVIAGLFLLIIGVAGLVSKPKEKRIETDTTLGVLEEFISGFVLTITNPLTAIVFFISFANISHKIGNGLDIATLFVIGIFIGSNLWWLLLTFIADRIAHKINHKSMNRINKWFAIIITFLGVLILSGIVIKHLVY